MAHLDVTLTSASVTEIAGPHRSTVAAILRAARQGLFTTAEAELLIDRVRTHLTTLPLSSNDSRSSAGGELTSEALQNSRDRTIS